MTAQDRVRGAWMWARALFIAAGVVTSGLLRPLSRPLRLGRGLLGVVAVLVSSALPSASWASSGCDAINANAAYFNANYTISQPRSLERHVGFKRFDVGDIIRFNYSRRGAGTLYSEIYNVRTGAEERIVTSAFESGVVTYTVQDNHEEADFAVATTGSGTVTVTSISCISRVPPAPSVVSIAPDSGTAGTPVTITGANFVSDRPYVVDFSGATAAATYVNATTLTATVPAHASGDVEVTVTDTSTSTAATGSTTFEYLAAPVVANEPSDAVASAGATTTFRAARKGSSSVRWQVSTDSGSSAYSDITDGGDYSGATTNTLTVTSRFSLDQNHYRAVFTNAAGSATSSPGRLTVRPAAPTVSASLSPSTISAGGSATLTLSMSNPNDVRLNGVFGLSGNSNNANYELPSGVTATGEGTINCGGYSSFAAGATAGQPIWTQVPANSASTCTFTLPVTATEAGVKTFADVGYALSASGAGSSEGSVSVAGGSLTVTAAAAARFTVVAASSSASVGGAPTAVTVTAVDAGGSAVSSYSGTVHFTSTDSAATLPADITLTNGVGTASVVFGTAGSQRVTATDTVTGSITGVTDAITVGRGAQTIRFTTMAPEKAQSGGPTYDVTATASSGLAVNLRIDASSSAVCTISAGVVSFTGPGTCTINANQAGNGSYDVAPEVQQSFSVAQGVLAPTLSITTSPTAVYVGNDVTLTVSITNPNADIDVENLRMADPLETTGALVVAAGGVTLNPCGLTYSAAVGGSSVQITGGTIAANSTCAFEVAMTAVGNGSVGAFVTLNSDSTPNGVGSLNLSVANRPAPRISALSPSTGPVSGGTTVVITGTNLGAATAVTFGSRFAASYRLDSATQITAITPTGAGVVDVAVTTAAGTSVASASTKFQFATPATVTSVSPSQGPVAGGQIVTLTGTGFSLAEQPGAVKFGTVDAIYKVDSDTSMTATVPAGAAGAVNVTVTTSGGAPVLPTAQYTYQAPPTVSARTEAIAYGQSTSIDLQGSATGSVSSIQIASGPAHGTLTTATPGNYLTATYQPTTGYAGPDSFTYTATGPGGVSVPATVSITVGAPTVTVSWDALGSLLTGNWVSSQFTASGGQAPYTYAISSPVPGLTLDTSTGLLSGTLTSIGGYSFTVTATDSSAGGRTFSGSVSGTVAVTKGTPDIKFSALSNVALSTGSRTVSATSSRDAPILFESLSPSVCSVSATTVNLLSTGVCIIAAKQSGNTHFNDAVTVSQRFTITSETPTITSEAASGSTVGSAFSQSNAAAGGRAPYTYAVASGVLPGGTSLNPSTGLVSGMLTTAGAYTYSIQVTDSLEPPVTATGISVSGTIGKGDQTLRFSAKVPASATAGGESYTMTATATSGLPADLSVDGASNGICSITGGAVSFTGAGTCTINADQPGSSDYNAAPRIQRSIVVSAAAVTVTGLSPDSGPTSGGTPVTLTGTGLMGATLTVGGVSVAPTATSATSLSFVTPEHDAGIVAVVVTTAEGTASISFTYVAPIVVVPAPVAMAVSADVAYNSTGHAIGLTATGSYTTLSVDAAPAHGTVTISGATATYVPATGYHGPDSFTYLATGPGGASAPATVTLTVAAPPPPVVAPPPPNTVPIFDLGTPGFITVDLATITVGQVTRFDIVVQAQHGSAVIEAVTVAMPAAMQLGGAQIYRLRYTPTAGFMGVDTVSVVAVGPGGVSVPAVFTFNVPGQAPNLSAQAVSNASVTLRPTEGLTGGPFQAIRITRQPTFGTAVVQGLEIVFTPGVRNSGATSLEYVIDLPFGPSAAGRIDLVANSAPSAQALTARTPAGRPVTVRISDGALGGPLTGAAVTGITPVGSATAALVKGGTIAAPTWDLTFTPLEAFTGEAVVNFTLTNAFATTAGTLKVTVDPRPDPSQDPDVRGVISSQVASARRFADAQTDNFNRRLEQIRQGRNSDSNMLNLNAGFAADRSLLDPQTQLRQQLGGVRRTFGDEALRSSLGLLDPAEDERFNRRDRSTDPFTAPATTEADVLSGHQRAVEQDGAGQVSTIGVWAAGGIDWGRRDASTGARDYRFTTSGVSAGSDVRISDTLVVGLGAGYGFDRTEVGSADSQSEGRSVVVAAYGGWKLGSALSVSGVAGYGDLSFDSRRWATDANGGQGAWAFGRREGEMLFGSLSLAADQDLSWVRRSVYARLDAQSVTLNAFTEQGADIYALSYQPLDVDSLSTTLGLKYDWRIERRQGVLSPSVRLEWTHAFDHAGTQTVTYADWLTSPRYGVALDSWDRDTLELWLEGGWSIGEQLDLSASYRAAVGNATASQGLQLKLRTRF